MAIRYIRAAEANPAYRPGRMEGDGQLRLVFPNSYGAVDLFLAAVGIFDRQVDRHGLAAFVCNEDRPGILLVAHVRNRQVGIAALIEPTFPEPVAIAAGPGIETAEEIDGDGMFAVPVFHVFVDTA